MSQNVCEYEFYLNNKFATKYRVVQKNWTFLEVCSSYIWYHRNAIHISKCWPQYVEYTKLIRRWDGERELLRRHCTRTTKYENYAI